MDKYDKLTYLELLEERKKVNEAISNHQNRDKIEVYVVDHFGTSYMFESVEQGVADLKELFKDESVQDLQSMFRCGIKCYTEKVDKAVFDKHVHKLID